MSEYKALAFIRLSDGPDGLKSPGDVVSLKELHDAGQTDEDIQALKKCGALGKPSDDLHPDHRPVSAEGISDTEKGSGTDGRK